jgi:hypothetical protein
MSNNDAPHKLWQCKHFTEQKAWCRRQIEAGHILTDPQIWLGGAEPENVIRALRRSGMKIETCRVKTIDAAGVIQKRWPGAYPQNNCRLRLKTSKIPTRRNA